MRKTIFLFVASSTCGREGKHPLDAFAAEKLPSLRGSQDALPKMFHLGVRDSIRKTISDSRSSLANRRPAL